MNQDQFTDEFGREYFTCAVCGDTFISNPDFPHEERMKEMQENMPPPYPDDPVHNVCGDCYKKVMERVDPAFMEMVKKAGEQAPLAGRTVHYTESAAGVVPESTGHVMAFTRDQVLALFGLPPDYKVFKFNQYVQIVAQPAQADHYIIAPEKP